MLGEQSGEVAFEALGALAAVEVGAERGEELGQFGQRGARCVWDSGRFHTRSTIEVEPKFT
jgi:hypothetical protein